MVQGVVTKLTRTNQEGQVTIPGDMLRALGITEPTLMTVTLEGDRLVLSKMDDDSRASVREYSDEEIAEFMEVDRISPELAQWVRERYPSRLTELE